jgi:hypothetical protein
MSDEDRLRIRLRERVAAVPVVADLDDVASRIHRRQHSRSRSLVLIGVLALVVGTVGGFAAGRTGRDSAPEIVAAGASSATDAVGPVAPGVAQGPGISETVRARLFVRATSDGVAIRVYQVDGAIFKNATGASTPGFTSIEAEMSTDAAVAIAATGWTSPPTLALGALDPGSFGVNEQAPVQYVVVQTASGVARVRASFAGGGTDEMQPEHGVAVLARVGTNLPISVSALDGDGHVTFTESVPTTRCVSACIAGTDPGGSNVPEPGAGPTLPASGPQQPVDVAAAKKDVGSAVAGAFDGAASDTTRVRSVAGGAALVSVFDQLRHGQFADSVGSAQTVLEGVVFLSPTTATAKFHSHLGSGTDSGPYLTDAVLTSAGWQVTRASYCQLASVAGANCP